MILCSPNPTQKINYYYFHTVIQKTRKKNTIGDTFLTETLLKSVRCRLKSINRSITIKTKSILSGPIFLIHMFSSKGFYVSFDQNIDQKLQFRKHENNDKSEND